MISLKNVEKSYKLKNGFYYVLRQITLTVEPGDFVSVMGPSGAGKSTLLHILGLHYAEWEGEFYLWNQPVHKLTQKNPLNPPKSHTRLASKPYNFLVACTL